jgi:hypothetical protein
MVNVLTSILGGCISGAIGFASAYVMSAISARRVAAERLRLAFAPELASMRRAHADKTVDRKRLVEDAFSRHAVAIEEYRPFVSPRSRAAYQTAWQNYYQIGGNVRFYDYFIE